MLVTIATPTYNRAHLLPRLYESLCIQSNKDFEWIIVDDGSTDSTPQVIQKFIDDKKLNIRHYRTSNGGKHRAVNLAANEAKGDLFFIADSDDWLPENAIDEVVKAFIPIKDQQSICGICGLDQYADGSIVGSGLPYSQIDASPNEIREKWNVTGDLKEVFRTAVLKEFPFPEIENERFCPEVLLWNRIGKKYKLRYINKPIYSVEYQPDGITSGITLARMNSPIASMMTYSEWYSQTGSLKLKLRLAINYWRFAFCAPKNKRIGIKGWGNMLLPFGALYHFSDIRTHKSFKTH
ncbi:MAG: glycosyltransferase family 2 protein [Muribaculaceae bacterium]|nr:glycosyltransferase family 2 protein [Muribaculaceae bacterium]